MEAFPISAPAFHGNSRVVPAGNGFDWLKQGWAFFVMNPVSWVVMTLFFLVLGFVSGLILLPLLLAGLLQVCQKISGNEAVTITDLFAGFRRNALALFMLGVLFLVASLGIYFVAFAFCSDIFAGSQTTGNLAGGIFVALGGFLLAMLLSLVMMIPLMMAFWFAPALVFFNNMPVVEALKASFSACMKNFVPFLVYGLIIHVLGLFAAYSFGLGYFILVPVLVGSVYASYRDIFVAN